MALTREAGVESATVDGTLQIPQYGQPTIDIGFIDEKGNWQGRKSSDRDFIGITRAESIPNGSAILVPDTNNFPMINMRGFTDLLIALKPTNGGNVAIKAVIGPDTQPFANLTPVNAAITMKINSQSDGNDFTDGFQDTAETLTADVWNIYMIQKRLSGQQNMQFQITNNSGGESTIQFGFMRLV